jgi:hypothetical protein
MKSANDITDRTGDRTGTDATRPAPLGFRPSASPSTTSAWSGRSGPTAGDRGSPVAPRPRTPPASSTAWQERAVDAVGGIPDPAVDPPTRAPGAQPGGPASVVSAGLITQEALAEVDTLERRLKEGRAELKARRQALLDRIRRGDPVEPGRALVTTRTTFSQRLTFAALEKLNGEEFVADLKERLEARPCERLTIRRRRGSRPVE